MKKVEKFWDINLTQSGWGQLYKKVEKFWDINLTQSGWGQLDLYKTFENFRYV